MALKEALIRNGSKMLHWVNTNSPALLTGITIGGVVLTAITSVRAYKRTTELIQKNELEDAPFKEKAAETWHCWIGPVLVGGATIAACIGAQKINHSRQLAMIASYDILKTEAQTFKEHAIEEIGKNKVRKIEHDIHEEELKKAPEPTDKQKEMCDVETGGILLWDRYSGQYIPTTYEKVYRAAEHVNEELRPYGKGGRDWYSHADFIVDCGGEYSEACEKWGYVAKPFGDAIDVNDICDPHIQEYKGHRCTIVYLNVFCEDKNFL